MWFLIFAAFILWAAASAISAPSRSAKSLKTIERELRRRGDA